MDDEGKKTLEVSSISSNRFYVMTMTVRDPAGSIVSSQMRLAFGEMIDGELHYHSAVTMSEIDAIALRDKLCAMYPAVTLRV